MNRRFWHLRPMIAFSVALLMILTMTNFACDDETALPSAPEAATETAPERLATPPEAAEAPLPSAQESDAWATQPPAEGLDAPGPSANKQSKQDICHWDQDTGTFKIINIAAPAVPAHLNHGDHVPLTFFADNDGDGFGSGPASTGCMIPPGFVDNDEDCDDGDADTFPGAAPNDDPDACMRDADGDDYGDASASGAVTPGSDCNDGDAAINPAAAEICDGIDNNCDGNIDEGLTFDIDGDGFSSIGSCQGTADDCNDNNAAINPAAAEVCNGIDDNCDGTIDEGLTFDVDGDGFTSGGSCEGSADDCDDNDPDVNPGAPEVCGNGIDDDCDGTADEVDECPASHPPVAVDDNFVMNPPPVACVVPTCAGGSDRTCVLNAPAGIITANDSDPDSPSFDAFIDGNITDAGWTCNADHLCTTDAGFNGGASSLAVNTDGSFDLVYTTSQNFIFGGPADVVIAEFLYFNEDPDGNTSNIARVMISVHCPAP